MMNALMWGASRTGRYAKRSMSIPMTAPTGMAKAILVNKDKPMLVENTNVK